MSKVSFEDLWGAIWSADGMGIYWIEAVGNANKGSIDLEVPQDLTILDTEEQVWILVTKQDLMDAYEAVLESGMTHCGGYTFDLEDPDACFGDIILQHACWGEVIYG